MHSLLDNRAKRLKPLSMEPKDQMEPKTTQTPTDIQLQQEMLEFRTISRSEKPFSVIYELFIFMTTTHVEEPDVGM